MKALIIDDDPDIQEVVALCLEVRWPEIEVETAGDGQSGIDAVKRIEPDIVILDLGLPDLKTECDNFLNIRVVLQYQSAAPKIR